VTTQNVLLAIEEKRKWEARLQEMEKELELLIKERKNIMVTLVSIRKERKNLYDRLCDHHAQDAETSVYKTQGDAPRIVVR